MIEMLTPYLFLVVSEFFLLLCGTLFIEGGLHSQRDGHGLLLSVVGLLLISVAIFLFLIAI